MSLNAKIRQYTSRYVSRKVAIDRDDFDGRETATFIINETCNIVRGQLDRGNYSGDNALLENGGFEASVVPMIRQAADALIADIR